MDPFLKKRGGTARGNHRLRHRFHAKHVRFALHCPGFRRSVFLLPPKEHRLPEDAWLFCSDQSLGILAVNFLTVRLKLYLQRQLFPIRGKGTFLEMSFWANLNFAYAPKRHSYQHTLTITFFQTIRTLLKNVQKNDENSTKSGCCMC